MSWENFKSYYTRIVSTSSVILYRNSIRILSACYVVRCNINRKSMI